MHPSRNSTSARKNATGESPSAAATSVVSTDIDWVETAPTSQAPLMPVCSDGLSRRTITAVKNAYITTNHSARPSTHSSRAGRNASATNSSCVPSTPVADDGEEARPDRVVHQVGEQAAREARQPQQRQPPQREV